MPAQTFKISYLSSEDSGNTAWQCPSNIALIKYWGKRDHQLPSNPSLSITLLNSCTETSIEYEYIEVLTAPGIHFTYDDTVDKSFEKRVTGFIENMILDIPVLHKMRLNIRSKNNFPHSAGIASSASAFGSLALCLCSIEAQVMGSAEGSADFFRKASYLARLGSGSACRSIYGGYVVWGEDEDHADFSNLFAQPFPFDIHPVFTEIQDTILIVSSDKKPLSSSDGHNLMKTHPYAFCRYNQGRSNHAELINVLQHGDMDGFIKIVENEALSIHGLLLSSDGGPILLKPESLQIINKVIGFRRETHVPVCFTIDAGPNIHLIYPLQYKNQIIPFIQDELLQHCENSKFIDDQIGSGPIKL